MALVHVSGRGRTLAGAVVMTMAGMVFLAAPAVGSSDDGAPSAKGAAAHRVDNLPGPQTEKQKKLRDAAVDAVVKGNAKVKDVNGSRVIELDASTADKNGKNQKNKNKKKYVQYDVEQDAKILSFLVDFGTETKSPQGGSPGPLNNQIPQPDRKMDGGATDDNSTLWVKDFNKQHYADMMFGATNSFKDFYAKASNGRYNAGGDVSDWVTVPYNEARYGHNPVPGDGTSEAEGSWSFIGDSAQAWYDAQKKAGKSDQQIKDYLKQFDQWDRYDYDGDGDFNEPDGYIDHFQAIHAGEGEEGGGGAEGEDAIWSHRWYAYGNNWGKQGPSNNKAGGAQIGNTGMWIGDYTTEPENGGLGVFTHEYGHDLGLPDLYDTTGGASNGVTFWSLMNSGSWLNDGKEDIGSRPGNFGPWEKLQLGWLDATTIPVGQSKKIALGPSDRDSAKYGQAALVQLPDQTITHNYNKPASGSYEWWGGATDETSTSLTRSVDLTGKKQAQLSANAWYDIEDDYDFLYAEVSTDGGANWQQVGDGVTGTHESWTKINFDLSKYAGKKIDVRFRYATDQAQHGKGAFLDDIAVTADGSTVFSDDVESGDNGWKADGFKRINGSVSEQKSHYYLVENRQYNGYDTYLKTGPYNFGFMPNQPLRVEHLPFQTGMLVWYVNNAYEDNNVSQHVGGGQVLPVDAHAKAMKWSNGKLVTNRIQSWDATFSRNKTPDLTLHSGSEPTKFASQKGVATFDDGSATNYFDAENKFNSVKTAGSGVKITVSGETADRMNLDVQR